MNISQTAVEINNRFFLAVQTLKDQKEIRGLQTLTREWQINRWNLISVRDEPSKRVIKVEYLTYLVRDYKINAEWLLTGFGKMFK
ncbi:MAG: hypothetical protein A2X18_07455 [Bacteroidetes bacterium GWF2_40_14]|nr:MAG: hypothetical protein A2X18_07455 [Bacteroidetes bacterium GWF2_40_14]